MNNSVHLINHPLLEVKDLRTYFYTGEGVVKAVDGVDLSIGRGEIFGLVGESGCGKTVTALSILRLIDQPGKIVTGHVNFDGLSFNDMTYREMNDIRGSRIAMIFQQPQSSLNPVFTVGSQVAEVLQVHEGVKADVAWDKAEEILGKLDIPDAVRVARAYPHELSGGQAQRVMIAMALILAPDLLIADEATTALDVTIQAQILDLLKTLRSTMGTSIILITHDMGVIAEMVDRVAVMYAGQIVEQTDSMNLFDKPLHPYTQGLVASVLTLGGEREVFELIPGTKPKPINLPPGCRFADRCAARVRYDLSICEERDPYLLPVEQMHSVRCWLYHSFSNH